MIMNIFEKIDKIKSEYDILGKHVACNSNMPQITLDIYKRALNSKSEELLISNSKLSCIDLNTRQDRIKLYTNRTILRIEYEMIQQCLYFIDKPLEEKLDIDCVKLFYCKMDEIYNDNIKDTISNDLKRLSEIG